MQKEMTVQMLYNLYLESNRIAFFEEKLRYF